MPENNIHKAKQKPFTPPDNLTHGVDNLYRNTPGLLAFNVGTHGLNALPTDTSPLAESSTDAPTGPGLSWS